MSDARSNSWMVEKVLQLSYHSFTSWSWSWHPILATNDFIHLNTSKSETRQCNLCICVWGCFPIDFHFFGVAFATFNNCFFHLFKSIFPFYLCILTFFVKCCLNFHTYLYELLCCTSLHLIYLLLFLWRNF